MQQKKEKKSGSGSTIFWIIVIAAVVASTIGDLRYTDEEAMWIGIITIAAVIFCWFVLSAAKKQHGGKKNDPRPGRTKTEHTHDRIDTEHYSATESPYQHYKTQLDGFLKAGIIEKSEYRVLLERYVQDFGNR